MLKDKITDGTDSINTGSVVVSGTVVKVLSPAGTGSPATWGRVIQAGSGATSAGSVLWVVFGNAFSTVPKFVAQGADGGTGWFAGSPLVAGSARVYSQTASQRFDWIAVG